MVEKDLGSYMTKPPVKSINENLAGEIAQCLLSCEHFISNHCVIDDKSDGKKFKFVLWPSQSPILDLMVHERQVVALKARQVGFTWLALCKSLWTGLLSKPGSTILLFSRRDDEAVELLTRTKRVYDRLPKYLKYKIVKSDAHQLTLSNGTEFKAFPVGTGDSYTASEAVVDEFDLIDPEMQVSMMESIKPTVDQGGNIYLISKANKKVKWANSLFKSIYREAKTGQSRWKPAFLPWYARPDRKEEDYAAWRRESFNTTGSYDSLWGNYPSTEDQALAPSSGDKRFPQEWLQRCHRDQRPATPEELVSLTPQLTHIKGICVYKDPAYGRKYVGGADPAEGVASSNPSALVLLDALTGEEVLSMNQRLSPKQTGKVIEEISKVYNNASWMVLRNNHGHALIGWLEDNTTLRLLEGEDKRVGWAENKKTKAMMFDDAAEKVREGQAIIHSYELYAQLSMVEADTLESPITEGNQHGDLASAFVAALKGCDIDHYGNFIDRDFQWEDRGGDSRSPFGASDHRRPSGPFGTSGGGSGFPFGVR